MICAPRLVIANQQPRAKQSARQESAKKRQRRLVQREGDGALDAESGESGPCGSFSLSKSEPAQKSQQRQGADAELIQCL